MNTLNAPVRSPLSGRRLTTTLALLGTLSVGILAGSVMTRGASAKEAQQDTSDARALTIPSPVTLSNGFSAVVKQVAPAVVNINTESLPKQSTNRGGGQQQRRRNLPQNHPNIPNGGGNDENQQGDMQDFFNRFFGGQGGPNGQGGGGGDDEDGGIGGQERKALGSGFIVDSRGYIITNNHVVDKADKIYVKLSTDPDNGAPGEDGHPARVVGVDKDTDIAVIKIDVKEPLPTVKLGNSDGAQVGDWVLALGSPFSLAKTVTAGIVSAKDRANLEGGAASQFQKFIQTDAAINPGNSGGPLVDLSGQVIGMNTAIYTSSMGSQGVGFAMPSNIIAGVYNMLISPTHKVVRGSIGIQFQSAVSAAVQRQYGFQNGVMVNRVTPDAGAAKAGIQSDDIITAIDGRNIKNGDDLVADISARKVGSSVKLSYLRSGKPQTANVTIGDRAQLYADNNNAPDSDSPQEADAGQGKLGITVTAVPPATASKLSLKGGVQVSSVRPGSLADEINLVKGYIIVAINKQPVTDESSYKAIVSKLKPGEDVVFVVRAPSGPNLGNTFLGGTLPQ